MYKNCWLSNVDKIKNRRQNGEKNNSSQKQFRTTDGRWRERNHIDNIMTGTDNNDKGPDEITTHMSHRQQSHEFRVEKCTKHPMPDWSERAQGTTARSVANGTELADCCQSRGKRGKTMRGQLL